MTTFFDPRTKQKRAFALDALRGLSILLMVFSGVIPFGVLPDWMYHAQVPPPNHVFNPSLPGITWVDLVFPFFLFTMGAAIPLALTRRIEKGVPFWKLSLSSLERGVLLAAFALFVMQIRPYQISDTPTPLVWLAGLAGFLLLIPMMARLPEKWDSWLKYLVRGSGWAGAVVFMVLVRFRDGSGFSLYRSDIIILVLSNMAVFTAFFWLATRKSMLLRLGILALLLDGSGLDKLALALQACSVALPVPLFEVPVHYGSRDNRWRHDSRMDEHERGEGGPGGRVADATPCRHGRVDDSL